MTANDTLRLNSRTETERPEARSFKPDPKILQAIQSSSQVQDYFGYDNTKRPLDMVYEGKGFTIAGWDDRKRQADLDRTGWAIVPKSRHPECATDDPEGKKIIIGGLVLMERHEYYDKKAREIEKRASEETVTTQFERLKISDDPAMGPRKITRFNRDARQAVSE